MTLDTIKDLIKNPNITADDLLTKTMIMNHFKLSPSNWDNRKISSILSVKNSHTRYNFKRKAIRGWTKEQVKFAVTVS
ncbi:hypothetical protein [Lactobacillus sp. LL6]|uniref:hypothetical protein n=1 Tax=Lactobacillus sp. LL6 TaxID=2596827 RepID=UPI001184FCEC|nr:hypothetical protein [Lactobacillus sp. LL6]TSO25427.1 hypothetical protein FOD82_09360 [Lactobacillus sp. LL6]